MAVQKSPVALREAMTIVSAPDEDLTMATTLSGRPFRTRAESGTAAGKAGAPSSGAAISTVGAAGVCVSAGGGGVCSVEVAAAVIRNERAWVVTIWVPFCSWARALTRYWPAAPVNIPVHSPEVPPTAVTWRVTPAG